jgi:hypothetical protein
MGFAAACHREFTQRPLVCTSLNDSIHKDGSLHYQGLAVDLRTRDLNHTSTIAWYIRVRDGLDPLGFDCLLERDHLHIEYDPKGTENWWQKDEASLETH